MTGFILISLALFLGDALPWTVRVLMLVGGAASFVLPFARGRGQGDGDGSSYPYPAQDDVLDGDDG